MKRIIALLVLGFLLVTILTGCSDPAAQLQDKLENYSKIMQADLPEDLRLTIYYIDPRILTAYAWNVDTLIKYDETQKIVIEREEILSNIDAFKKLNWSVLTPTKNEPFINARLYYVIESGEYGKLLEVVISEVRGNVVVNGIEVEYNTLFYELIWPFLPEDARIMYGYGVE